jgi:uncharacterized SAM-dependent methyltransferase
MTKYKMVSVDGSGEEQEVEIEHLELAKDKQHMFVYYIDVGNVAPQDVPVFMDKIKNMLTSEKTKDYLHYFVPFRGQITSKICHIDLSKPIAELKDE